MTQERLEEKLVLCQLGTGLLCSDPLWQLGAVDPMQASCALGMMVCVGVGDLLRTVYVCVSV